MLPSRYPSTNLHSGTCPLYRYVNSPHLEIPCSLATVVGPWRMVGARLAHLSDERNDLKPKSALVQVLFRASVTFSCLPRTVTSRILPAQTSVDC